MYYSYNDFLGDIKLLQSKVQASIGTPKALLHIIRGGMTMSHMLALSWNIREVYGVNAISYSDKKQDNLIIKNIPKIQDDINEILILDEIIDSGKTLYALIQKLQAIYPDKRFFSAVIFQKRNTMIKADFFVREATEWIDFFWEVDMLSSKKSK